MVLGYRSDLYNPLNTTPQDGKGKAASKTKISIYFLPVLHLDLEEKELQLFHF